MHRYVYIHTWIIIVLDLGKAYYIAVFVAVQTSPGSNRVKRQKTHYDDRCRRTSSACVLVVGIIDLSICLSILSVLLCSLLFCFVRPVLVALIEFSFLFSCRPSLSAFWQRRGYGGGVVNTSARIVNKKLTTPGLPYPTTQVPDKWTQKNKNPKRRTIRAPPVRRLPYFHVMCVSYSLLGRKEKQ